MNDAYTAPDEPKTLADVGVDLWRAKYFVLTGLALGLLAAAGFMLNAVEHYRAHMIVAPANPMNGAEASSLLADDNLFALRYLVQRVGVVNSSDFLRFENTYDGASVAEALLADPKIVAGLKLDKSFEFLAVKTPQNPAEFSDYIRRRVRLEPVGASGLRRLVYLHPSRDFGRYFLHNLHRTTDELIRQKTRADAAQRVTYLQDEVRRTNNPEHRRALTSLLMEQERLRMLASVETPYAAAVVEPPAAGAKPGWPMAALVYAGFAAVGALLGFAVYGMRGAARSEAAYAPVSARRWFARRRAISTSVR